MHSPGNVAQFIEVTKNTGIVLTGSALVHLLMPEVPINRVTPIRFFCPKDGFKNFCAYFVHDLDAKVDNDRDTPNGQL